MECNSFAEEKLGGTESPEFREHLGACPACARDVEEIDEIRRLYREASTERYPGGVPGLRRRWPVGWVPAAAAALAMIAVLVTSLVSPLQPPAARVEPPAPFFRVHLEAWDREEASLNAVMGRLWYRLESIERSAR
jgi:anti-sigma factor RsiW